MRVLKERKVEVNGIAFSPDGTKLVAGLHRSFLQLWDVAAGRLDWSARAEGFAATNAAVGFQPGGAEVLTLHESLIKAHDAATGKSLGMRPKGNRAPISYLALSADRTRLAAAFDNSLVLYGLPAFTRLWSVNLKRWDTFPASLGFSGDGRRVALGRGKGSVWLYDAAGGERTHQLEPQGVTVKALALSPDGAALAACCGTTLVLWRLDEAPTVVKSTTLGKTHFQSAAWHPSGGFFATANGDGKVDYWDARTGERRESFDWGFGKLNDVIFDASGDRAACCAKTGEIVVWDVDR